jgi:hypothetical protein
MEKIIFIMLFIFSSPLLAKFDADFSGNLEAQVRHAWNNDLAKGSPLYQNWSESDFYLLYGNLSSKIELDNSRIDANLFGRYTQSELYRGTTVLGQDVPYIAPNAYLFPKKLVARDIFNLQDIQQGDNYQRELILNKLFYEWDYDEHRFMAGRIYINYGLGEIFNPINPFNQPTGLTAISQVAQGNDGLNFTFFVSDKYTIDFYFLGDKNLAGYENQIQKTLWAHGEYLYSNNLQFDYVIGEDQNRHKLGGQVKYNFSEAMIFFQTLYQSSYVDKQESDSLWDVMIGYDQQVTNKWHVRFEGGHQKEDSVLKAAQQTNPKLINFNNRFLPSEYFLALANQYEMHPLVKLGGTIINDVKTGFTYFITRNTFDLGHSTEAELYAYLPMAKGNDTDNKLQKLVTTDIGFALRTFF